MITVLPGENLKVGGRIYRKCQIKTSKFSTKEPLQYVWLKDGSVEVATGQTLDITILDASVNGEYSCMVKSVKYNKSYTKESSIKIGKFISFIIITVKKTFQAASILDSIRFPSSVLHLSQNRIESTR